jgi:hypothetical protein
MTNNVNQVVTLAPTYTFWSKLSGNYPMGTTGTISNGSGAGMGRLRGISEVNIPMPAAGNVTPQGDNGPITRFIIQPQELPGGTISALVLDQNFVAAANGVKVYAEATWDEVGDGPACYSFSDLGFVFNCPANSQESGSVDEGGWNVYELYKVQVQAPILAQMQSGQNAVFPNNASCKRASAAFTGRAFSAANDGSTAFVVRQYWSDYPVTYYTFIGDNSTLTATLNETLPAAGADYLQYWLAGVKKTYTTDFSANASTGVVTFVAAPGTAAKAVLKQKFVPTC